MSHTPKTTQERRPARNEAELGELSLPARHQESIPAEHSTTTTLANVLDTSVAHSSVLEARQTLSDKIGESPESRSYASTSPLTNETAIDRLVTWLARLIERIRDHLLAEQPATQASLTAKLFRKIRGKKPSPHSPSPADEHRQ